MGINNNINESYSDVQIFTTVGTNTWVKPTNCNFVYVVCIGGGGGGGGGAKRNSGDVRFGGIGGGGGAYSSKFYIASYLSETEPVIVGSGGTGGLGATVSGSGGDGATGGTSTFSSGNTSFSSYGGGPGLGGDFGVDNMPGGGGGGTASEGRLGIRNAGIYVGGGLPGQEIGVYQRAGSGCNVAGNNFQTGAEYGGGAGSGRSSGGTQPPAGHGSIFGGGGGGNGGCINSSNTSAASPISGGSSMSYATQYRYPSLPGTNGEPPTAGANGLDGNSAWCGSGGAGGGGATGTGDTSGANGGNGGTSGGGGGGGGAATNTGNGGNGGNGGRGEVRVYSW